MKAHKQHTFSRMFTTFASLLLLSAFCEAEEASTWGDLRLSLFAQTSSIRQADAFDTSYGEFIANFSLRSPYREEAGVEYAIDLRTATYTNSETRDARVSIYNAYAGFPLFNKNVLVRVGQMWLNELGASGSLAGGLVQIRGPESSAGKLRFGAFGGKEPEILDAGYVPNVTRFGGYAALDGERGRSHIVGYLSVRNSGLTEQSLLVFTNYLPVGKEVFLYQSAEVDLAGPANEGSGGLRYFFVNGRYSPTPAVELQGTFHRGRSIDSRSITEDQLNGRPVDPLALKGLLFESGQFRTTVRIIPQVFVFAGYGRDRTNRQDNFTDRWNYGFFTTDLVNTGVDLRLSGTRFDLPDGSGFNSWSVSAGRMVGSKVYLSGDYNSSAFYVVLRDGGDITVENRPRTNRWGVSALVHWNRSISILAQADRTTEASYSDTRLLTGLILRMR